MKAETIADILQLDSLINHADSQSFYSRGTVVKAACRVAASWSRLQVKRCNEPMTTLDLQRESDLECTLQQLRAPHPVVFENLHARIIYDNNREFYFPDLNK